MTLLYFLIILGIIIFIHELGHFFFAKKFGVHVYEFALGFGPQLFKFKRKGDPTIYALRLIPLGGFVHMLGEDVEDDPKIDAKSNLNNKPWHQKFIIIVAGVINNFILAIVIIFLIAIFQGANTSKVVVDSFIEDYPAEEVLKVNDQIVKINDKKIVSPEDFSLRMQLLKKNDTVKLEVIRDNQNITISIKPKAEKIDGNVIYRLGFNLRNVKEYGLFASIKYAFSSFASTIKTMFIVIGNLFTGNLSLNSLSGPVGIYKIVDNNDNVSLAYILNLIALLSINVGFINILPIPAFDGGRLLFLIIERVTKKPINPKIEAIIHNIFLFLLFALMIVITFNDITKLFN